MLILDGVGALWDQVACVVIEATRDTFADRLRFLYDRGFQLFDIVDQCYYDGVFAQADLVLVANRIFRENPRLKGPVAEGFDWQKWESVASLESLLRTGSEAGGALPEPVAAERRREPEGFPGTAVAAARAARRSARVQAEAAETGLFGKRAAIESCMHNPYQPALVWVPAFFGSMMQIDLREQVSQEIFLHGATEPALVDFFGWALEPGMVVYDVGAHIGFLSIVCAHLVGEAGEVVAFEPMPTTRIHLETNIRNSGLPWLRADPRAAWRSEGRLTFNDFGPGYSAFASVGAMRVPPAQAVPVVGTVEVEAVALDAVAQATGRRPDLVKIDVESAEGAVLEGMAGMLASGSNRPIIVIEVGDFPHLIAAGTPSSASLLRTLETRGYVLFSPRPGGLDSHAIREHYDYCNIVCVPQERCRAVLEQCLSP